MRLLAAKFIAPVPCLLEAAIVLQLVLGEYIEASVIAVLLVFNAVLGLMHEGRARATLAALKSRLALSASAYRDSAWQIVPAAELVPGDIVKLSLGTVVAADMRLSSGVVLIDQSTITGESLPVEAGPGFDAYAGGLVRRGEAVAEVVATGTRTKFGRTAELVRTAHVTSTQQRAIFRVVRNLAVINGVIAAGVIAYAYAAGLPHDEFVPLILLAVLATVPVALPATFTLATAIAAQDLARQDVLPTRLSAVDEAASMDVLCTDKTGTLTRNELDITVVHVFAGFDERHVVGLAALASAEGGKDPVDDAVQRAARAKPDDLPQLEHFVPFDPATKMSEATAVGPAGTRVRIVKGAFGTVASLCAENADALQASEALQRQGYRVLAVAVGEADPLHLAGLLALSDPPRDEAATCIEDLRRLGVKVLIATGDAAVTAEVIARKVGVKGAVLAHGPIPQGPIPQGPAANAYEVFAGVLPEDKFQLVKSLQAAQHVVGMCGDGANDAPALRQAQIGIAVSTATDVAKAAAGIVLVKPGLGGILAAVREGRITFQRILTYTLRSLVNKVRQLLFIAFGLVVTGHPILTPIMMVMLMITGDFLAMSATTDNVVPSPRPNTWQIGSLTVAGVALGLLDLVFCAVVLTVGKYWAGLDVDALQSLTMVALVFNGQAVFYVVRERRRLWSSRPSLIVVLASIADILILPTMAAVGFLVPRLPLAAIASAFAAAIVLALVLDLVKVALFRSLRMV